MKTQELIYARVKLQNPPSGKRIHISKDCTQIFYYNNREKVFLSTNNEFVMKQNFDFISTKVVSDGNSGWYKISLDVDINKLNDILRYPYNINGRRNLFDILKKCYNETKNTFTSHIILNLYEKVLITSNNDDFTDWFQLKEKTTELFCYLQSDICKVGEYYIDTVKGQFLRDFNPVECKMNGGIIHDKTYLWIESILHCELLSGEEYEYHELTLVYTKCTMIICDKSMCTYWLYKIKAYYPDAIIKIINTLKDHKSLSYNDLVNIDFIIINYDYLINKKYMSILDDYSFNNNKLSDIIGIIKDEYGSFDNIKEKTDVLLSLITWNRIIIDTLSINYVLKDVKAFELLMTMKACNKWIQIDKMPSIQNEYMMMYKFLFNDSNLNFPLYDEFFVIKYIGDMIYAFNNKKESSIIHEECMIVKSGVLEKTILKFLENIKCMDMYKFNDMINTLYENVITRQTYVDILDTINLNAEFSDLQCPICLNTNDQKNMLFTGCGHYYCITCILENLEYNHSCPMCRKEIALNDLYYIDDTCKNLRANELIKTLKDISHRKVDDKIYIYINNLKHKSYLDNYMKKYGIIMDVEWIYSDFNRIQKKINGCWRDNKSITVIFYDIYDEINKVKDHLKLNNYSNITINYFIYDILKDKVKTK